MKKILYILLCCVIFSCEKKTLEPLNSSGTTPGKIQIENVENIHGGVNLSYTLPENSDLLYVLAKYNNGVRDFEKKISFYQSKVKLEGFFEEGEYMIKLVGVNRAGVEGEETVVKVNPLKAPANLSIESLEIIAGFGGAVFSWTNVSEAPLTFTFMYQDSLGKMVPYEWVESDAESYDFSIRGMDTVETKFLAYITDRYFNVTDSVVTTLTPLYEAQLDVDVDNILDLEGDAELIGWSGPISGFFDGKLGWRESPTFATPSDGFPKFTFDMGTETKISRVWWKGRADYEYKQGGIERVKIYATNTLPSTQEEQDDMSNWDEIGEYSMLPPSGNDISNPSAEDKAVHKAGFDLGFPVSTPKYRYIRFQLLKNYWDLGFWAIGELKFYGSNK